MKREETYIISTMLTFAHEEHSFQTMYAFALLLFVLLTGAQAVPVFLFAGQSNLGGRANQAGILWSLENGNQTGLSLEMLLPILTDSRIEADTKHTLLQEAISKARKANTNSSMVEATALLKISARYPEIWNNITRPMESSYCSMNDFRYKKLLDLLAGEPVSPYSSCGNPWGSELMFSHVMQHHGLNKLAVPKLMNGATFLESDWMEKYWPALLKRIQTPLNSTLHPSCGTTSQCNWTAFVWHQGETEAAVLQMTKAEAAESKRIADRYYNNLVQFAMNVRKAMHEATPVYKSAAEIPLILVKLNFYFATRNLGPIVLAAQEQFIRDDPRAYGVNTFDLSQFYHMEAASQLIIGDRIAQVLLEAFEEGDTPIHLLPPRTTQVQEEALDTAMVLYGTQLMIVPWVQPWILATACAGTAAKFLFLVTRRKRKEKTIH